MISAAPDRRPPGKLLFRVHHLIRSVAQQKFFLHIRSGTGYDHLSPQLLQERGGLQRALKIIADGHDTYIIIINSKGAQKFLVGAVTDLGIGHIGEKFLYQLLLLVNSHNLMVQLPKLHGNIFTKTT